MEEVLEEERVACRSPVSRCKGRKLIRSPAADHVHWEDFLLYALVGYGTVWVFKHIEEFHFLFPSQARNFTKKITENFFYFI